MDKQPSAVNLSNTNGNNDQCNGTFPILIEHWAIEVQV